MHLREDYASTALRCEGLERRLASEERETDVEVELREAMAEEARLGCSSSDLADLAERLLEARARCAEVLREESRLQAAADEDLAGGRRGVRSHGFHSVRAQCNREASVARRRACAGYLPTQTQSVTHFVTRTRELGSRRRRSASAVLTPTHTCRRSLESPCCAMSLEASLAQVFRCRCRRSCFHQRRPSSRSLDSANVVGSAFDNNCGFLGASRRRAPSWLQSQRHFGCVITVRRNLRPVDIAMEVQLHSD